MVTEFGAEANRDGALYWAMNEFRVRPRWDGGNPRPTPPIHRKGLIDYDGALKPAWADAQRWYHATNQLGE